MEIYVHETFVHPTFVLVSIWVRIIEEYYSQDSNHKAHDRNCNGQNSRIVTTRLSQNSRIVTTRLRIETIMVRIATRMVRIVTRTVRVVTKMVKIPFTRRINPSLRKI